MNWLIVVDRARDWPDSLPGARVVRALDYLNRPNDFVGRFRVLNLCRSYAYQSTGYYVSLLADARGHRPLPDVMTMQDLKSRSVLRLMGGDLDPLIRRSLKPLQSDSFVLSIYFGRNMARRYEQLSRALFNLFPAPLLRARFQRRDAEWQLTGLRPIPLAEIAEGHRPFLFQAAAEHFTARRRPRSRKRYRFDLAMLVNPKEAMPPSNERALKRFERAANRVGFSIERIGPDDLGRLAEFDALFLRETTAVNHHSYRFARRADVLGAAVIDDPDSILRCTNKVFLAELLERHRVPTPRSLVVHRAMVPDIEAELGLPCVLKQPDGAFSQAVVKAHNSDELAQGLARFFEHSDLVLAQSYSPTEFDWRIGVLRGEPLFACRYFMARGHWQIIGRDSRGRVTEGRAETLALEQVPETVMSTALRAARAVGSGLYGVDLKEFDGRCQVIEVNDNPNIDAGYEDAVAGEALYDAVMTELLRRVEARKDRRT